MPRKATVLPIVKVSDTQHRSLMHTLAEHSDKLEALDSRTGHLETAVTTLKTSVEEGNKDTKEVLSIIKTGKALGNVVYWVLGAAASVVAILTAVHKYL